MNRMCSCADNYPALGAVAGGSPAVLDIGDGNALNIGQSGHRFEVVGTARADSNDPQSNLVTGRWLTAAS
jgi:hypothetical protein